MRSASPRKSMVRGVSISIRRVADRPMLKVDFMRSSAEAIQDAEALDAKLCQIPGPTKVVQRKQWFGAAADRKVKCDTSSLTSFLSHCITYFRIYIPEY